jgi:hypothetical protein
MSFEHAQAKEQLKEERQFETEETSFYADVIQKLYLSVVCRNLFKLSRGISVVEPEPEP